MRISSILTAVCLSLSVVPALAGCQLADQAEAATGTVSLPLTATATSGDQYRLVNGNFVVTGAQTVNLSSNSDPTASVLTADLPVGGYVVTLNSGWQLQKLDPATGTLTQVDAVLVSPTSQAVNIGEQQTALVTFQFRAGEDVIQFGQGRLNVAIAVDDGRLVCGAGTADCDGDGSCDDLTRSVTNCGACGVVCTGGGQCVAGVCQNSQPFGNVVIDPTGLAAAIDGTSVGWFAANDQQAPCTFGCDPSSVPFRYSATGEPSMCIMGSTIVDSSYQSWGAVLGIAAANSQSGHILTPEVRSVTVTLPVTVTVTERTSGVRPLAAWASPSLALCSRPPSPARRPSPCPSRAWCVRAGKPRTA